MTNEIENSTLPDQPEQSLNLQDEQQSTDVEQAGSPEAERAREERIRDMPAYLRRLG